MRTAFARLFLAALIAGRALSATAQAHPAPAQSDARRQQITEHARLAQSYLAQKQPARAIPELEALIQLDPANTEAQANLGVLLYFQGRFTDALPHLRAAIAAKPDLSKIRALLGNAEMRSGDPAAALKDLEAVFSQLPADQPLYADVGFQLIELYSASGELEKAAATIDDLKRAHPEDPHILYTAYRIYSDLAGESMLSLSLVAPDSAFMHQLMAHEESRQARNNLAIAQYRKAIEIDPHLPGVHFEIAELLHASDDPRAKEQALTEYQAAIKENPQDGKALSRLGEIYEAAGDAAKAQSYYQQALAIQPDDASASFGLGKVLILQNQPDQAIPLLEKSVRLEPTNATAHYRLSTLYRQKGRSDDAKRELELYLKYKQMKEKLRALYKELQITPQALRLDERDEK